jgi:hypothetical protein
VYPYNVANQIYGNPESSLGRRPTPGSQKENDVHSYTIYEIAKFDKEQERLQQIHTQLMEEQRIQLDLKRKQQREALDKDIKHVASSDDSSSDDDESSSRSRSKRISFAESGNNLSLPSTASGRRKSVVSASPSMTLRRKASSIIKERSKTSIGGSPARSRKNSIAIPPTANSDPGTPTEDESFLNMSSSVIKKRYAEIFNANGSKEETKKPAIDVATPVDKNTDLDENARQEALREKQFELQCARELKKPPYLSDYEIVNLQRSFLRNFPFHLWNDLTAPQINSIKSTLSTMKLGRFIQEFSAFCYWTFLKEYAAEPEAYDIDSNFLQVYEEIIDIVAKHKQSKLTLTVHLPITLLCIRVTSETIFRICYLNWWNSKYGELMAQKMDNLVSFLFDPQDYFSHLAPLESNVKERRIHQHLTQHQKKKNAQKTNSMYMLSPVVKYILNDASSLEARNLITKQTYSQKDLNTVMDPSIGDMLKPQVKSKLLHIYMSKFSMYKEKGKEEDTALKKTPRVRNTA